MELAQRLIDSGEKSTKIKTQADALTKASDDVALLRKISYLTKSEHMSLTHMQQVLQQMASDFHSALQFLIEEETRVAEQKQSAIAQVSALVNSLSTSGRIAFAIHYYPGRLAKHHLYLRSDATRLVGEFLQTAIESVASYAVTEAESLGIKIDAAVSQLWRLFESIQSATEKRYARRIKSYEAQLASVADNKRINILVSASQSSLSAVV